jgi:hypothetical protein
MGDFLLARLSLVNILLVAINQKKICILGGIKISTPQEYKFTAALYCSRWHKGIEWSTHPRMYSAETPQPQKDEK